MRDTEAIGWLEKYIERLEDEFDQVVNRYDGEQVELAREHAKEIEGGNVFWGMICGRYNHEM